MIAASVLAGLSCGLCELALRELMFGRTAWLQSTAQRVRDPGNFALPTEELYWALQYRFRGQGTSGMADFLDPRLGWTSGVMTGREYVHEAAGSAAGRRPILLYGDSMAECTVGAEACWQGLVERSDLAGSHVLLNYGVGGYGLDQTVLMLEASLGAWSEEEPIVIVGILVDGDLERCVMGLRDWPKPRFLPAGDGGLTYVPPAGRTVEEYLRSRSFGATSYLFRYLTYRAELLPRPATEWLLGIQDPVPMSQELTQRLVLRLSSVLEERGHQAFVVLFHLEADLLEPTWGERCVEDVLGRVGLPWVSSKVALLDDVERTGRDPSEYFITEGRGIGHYNPLGNEVVFRAFRRGLEGRFDGPSTCCREGWR